MDNNDIKMYYDLAKITNNSKLITDDFIQRVCLALFNHYLDSLGDKKLAFTSNFMANWEQDIIGQKIMELENLSTQGETVQDLVTGAHLANSESLEDFKFEVGLVKRVLFDALMR